MNNIDHFKEQIKHIEPFTKEHADQFIQRRLDLKVAYSKQELEDYFYSKIGKKLVYFMVSNKSGSKVEMLKLFEDEIEDYNFTFCMHSGLIPRFNSEYSSIKKVFKNHILEQICVV